MSLQKNAAECVKRFLNYCRTQALLNNPIFFSLKYEGLKALKLAHGSDYITHLSKKNLIEGLSAGYVKQDIRYLNKFYQYLAKENIIEPTFKQDTYKKQTIRKNGEQKMVEVYYELDIFADDSLGTIYPSNKKKKSVTNLKDFGKDRYLLVKEFIATAEAVAPDIVIGLYFQFFGGLRQGEVVNLTRDSILEMDESYVLDVEDKRGILFPGKKDTKLEQVKVRRYQGLMMHRPLEYAIEKQLEWLDTVRDKTDFPSALLLNKRTMRPITGSTYITKFNKVKAAYLEKLSKQGRIEHFNFLNAKDWSTHICRGCFTNFCLDIGMEIGEVAVARGDSNVNSVIDYLEEKVAVQTLREAMIHITKAFEYNSSEDGKISSSINQKKVANLKWEQ